MNCQERNKKILVAMSGGVDSSTAALLLKEQGYDVSGAFVKGWYPEGMACNWKEERRDAIRAAAKINIPLLTFDFSKEYEKKVVEYMKKEYSMNKTPNPDVMCNKYIKFGLFLDKALKMGFDYIATGHYVRMKKERNNFKLFEAKDKNKDQSYFLWTLTQKQLKNCLFPVGDYKKPEIRLIAKKFKLPVAEKKDSQGLCFVGKLDFASFLRKMMPRKKGDIKNMEGKILGKHDGVHFYTIGQRHGINVPGKSPYYIVAKDLKSNTLIIAEKKDEKKFYQKQAIINNINWINIRPNTKEKYLCRIRYRQPLQECKIISIGENSATIIFKIPQRALTSGQSLVLYKGKGKEMIGGGIIF